MNEREKKQGDTALQHVSYIVFRMWVCAVLEKNVYDVNMAEAASEVKRCASLLNSVNANKQARNEMIDEKI